MDSSKSNTPVIAAAVSLFAGVVSHLIFFPITENWHNNRSRRIARYAIGIVTNWIPCVMWFRLLHDDKDDANRQFLMHSAAYLVSFLWTGIGVVVGYVIDDARNGYE